MHFADPNRRALLEAQCRFHAIQRKIKAERRSLSELDDAARELIAMAHELEEVVTRIAEDLDEE